jgi:hypothetical protein
VVPHLTPNRKTSPPLLARGSRCGGQDRRRRQKVFMLNRLERRLIIEASISTIETMEDRRYAAMLYKDVKMLRSLLHDQLTYVHSSGTTDTKASYIAGLEAGTWDYRCIRRSKQTIKVQKIAGAGFQLPLDEHCSPPRLPPSYGESSSCGLDL